MLNIGPSKSRKGGMRCKSIIYRLDFFSLPRSLFPIHRSKQNPRQYYGSSLGSFLTVFGFISGLIYGL